MTFAGVIPKMVQAFKHHIAVLRLIQPGNQFTQLFLSAACNAGHAQNFSGFQRKGHML